MNEIEHDDQIPGVQGQENKHGSVGFALTGEWVAMKEVLKRPKERLNAGGPLPITGFTLGRGQVSGAIPSGLSSGFTHRFRQGPQNFDSALSPIRNQMAIIIARIQQQGSNQGRQSLHPRLQDVTLAGTARDGGAQHDANRGGGELMETCALSP